MDGTKEQRSMLLFLEVCATDFGGKVDAQHMNDDDFKIVEEWKKDGYVMFGRICSADITKNKGYWVELTDRAWTDAHQERKARFQRINDKRTWKKTQELHEVPA